VRAARTGYLYDVDAVNRRKASEDAVLVPLSAPVALAGNKPEFSPKDLLEEISRSAGGLKEPAVGIRWVRLRGEHVGDKIEHGVDLALVGVDLCKVPHALARLDLALTHLHAFILPCSADRWGASTPEAPPGVRLALTYP
jgi:hypothetical protein